MASISPHLLIFALDLDLAVAVARPQLIALLCLLINQFEMNKLYWTSDMHESSVHKSVTYVFGGFPPAESS